MSRTPAFKTIDVDSRIVVSAKAVNPFREGTKVYRRAAAVLAARGKPVEIAIKRGARLSTVRYLAKARVIDLRPAR